MISDAGPRAARRYSRGVAGDDEDALGWGDESGDPTHVDGRRSERASANPDGADDAADADEAGSGDAAARLSSPLLVSYGILAGIYLLYTVGWILGVQRDPFSSPTLFFEIMYQLGEFLAIASPAVWFFVTVLLTRGRRQIVRVVWLIVGAAVLLPWPFLLSGAGA